MSVIDRYYSRIQEILAEAFEKEHDHLEAAARLLAEANMKKQSIFAFGCNHAGLITLELYYRSGGMVTVNPVRAPGMMLDISPATMTSEMERMPGYGTIIFNNLPAKAGDVIIIHSVSGRNSVTVDMAQAAKEKGLSVIVVTNLNTATTVTSRHPSGKMLHDFADVLIDNHGDRGDASVELSGFPQKIAPSSTVVGAALLNSVTARASEILLENGWKPPVFMSGNMDGGDAYNKAVIAEHKENIFYM
ncbi:MAG: SIS domain-containing protein [Clostridia bacterium]|nr:SIS domain-containing protein [Clostridia bacterium]MBQ4289888.1 SIS domain-containing protein [Clostridia bacterium]